MLKGENILLRPLRKSDIEKTIVWRNSIEIIELAQLNPFPKTVELESQWFERVLSAIDNRNIYFAVDEIVSKEFIGIIQLTNIDYISGTAIWGFIIGDKSKHGKGYSVEAPRLLFNYAFNILNLRKVFGYPLATNIATIRMHEKIGLFKQEGILKEHFFFNGNYHDVLILSIYKKDFIKD